MNDLIARLEHAAGPDRELDCEIWAAAVGPRGAIDDDFWKEIVAANVAGDGDMPTYTESIDVALRLASGFEFEIGSANLINKYWAVLIAVDQKYVGKARTAAIAICVAALKARSITTGNGRGAA